MCALLAATLGGDVGGSGGAGLRGGAPCSRRPPGAVPVAAGAGERTRTAEDGPEAETGSPERAPAG
ncbi:hypothetical protein DBP15_25550 [Streptomyces sp. CS065A]|nr:hypothetical protein DBP15_25550 [Streptomyces sp. CS065A]